MSTPIRTSIARPGTSTNTELTSATGNTEFVDGHRRADLRLHTPQTTNTPPPAHHTTPVTTCPRMKAASETSSSATPVTTDAAPMSRTYLSFESTYAIHAWCHVNGPTRLQRNAASRGRLKRIYSHDRR